ACAGRLASDKPTTETRNPKNRKSGFTLIELLVVLGISSLLFLIGFASYREFNRRQQLTEAANLLKSDMLLAQQRALSGEKPAGCQGILNGYLVYFNTASSYQIIADCKDRDVVNVEDPVIKTASIDGGITKTAGPDTISFKVLAQGTTGATDVTLTLTQAGTGRTITITVTKTGSVY
ncbi:GspH/FimT family pseudopilin, partial [Candidatus Microgenomates bacterium]|nr:GspH/FimT family pseudopilin [Candidatus Microgenomates bacterium]